VDNKVGLILCKIIYALPLFDGQLATDDKSHCLRHLLTPTNCPAHSSYNLRLWHHYL